MNSKYFAAGMFAIAFLAVIAPQGQANAVLLALECYTTHTHEDDGTIWVDLDKSTVYMQTNGATEISTYPAKIGLTSISWERKLEHDMYETEVIDRTNGQWTSITYETGMAPIQISFNCIKTDKPLPATLF
ncbi:MAG TPA: hypothetical protein VGT99_05800 [Gammaproteobacteria bacterium]|nr:hypothetical protein [Gammaproteobacteria bacterium]